MPSTTSVLSSVLALGTLSYVVWFDYQRRHSSEFRRELRRKSKQFETERTQAVKASEQRQRTVILAFIEKSLKEDPLPTGLQAREQFFIAEIARADQLLSQAGGQLQAALAFYRALIAYPQPMDLLGMYEKSIPAPVLAHVRTMIAVRPPPAIANFIKSESAANTVE